MSCAIEGDQASAPQPPLIASPPHHARRTASRITLTGTTPTELREAISCANSNGASADTIDLGGQTVTLTDSFADYTGATGLPQLNSNITIRNDGDYHLSNFSVAIDAGANSLIPGGITTDRANAPRRYNDTGVADA